MPMAIEALRQIEQWGVAEIEATLRIMMRQIGERATELGLSVAPAQTILVKSQPVGTVSEAI